MNQEQRDLTLEQLLQEKVFSYDTEKYDFLSIMHKIFGVDDLSRLHELVPEASQPNFLDFQNDQGTWFHKTYYNSPFLPELLELYRRFVTEEIAPQFKSESIVYQTRPTFRVHLPNNLAVGQKHRDGDYHHPYGEVNYWVPFTRAWETNGFYVESAPDSGEFHGLDMNYGQVFRFNGNKCWHYNKVNETGVTRASFDFRVIPGDLYQENENAGSAVKSNLKFKIGSYYERYEKGKKT